MRSIHKRAGLGNDPRVYKDVGVGVVRADGPEMIAPKPPETCRRPGAAALEALVLARPPAVWHDRTLTDSG
jgi:hypothetical protein